MTTDRVQMDKFAETAKKYISLVESFDQLSLGEGLSKMGVLLPELHACVMALGGGEPEQVPDHERSDLDDRFELFSRVKEHLGEEDAYAVELPTETDNHVLTGSLADDFVDIYYDLSTGLELLEQQQAEKALRKWLETFRLHWGQHLFDAIFALQSKGQASQAS